MLKVGIIGTGGMGNVHIPCWDAIRYANIVCACDIRNERLQSSFKNSDVRLYSDLDRMLEQESLDILDVCTPSYLHKEHAIKALNKGINVICEKPACLNPEDAEEMYGIAERNNVKLMIAHVIRFWPEYGELKNMYENKTYGSLLNGYFWRIGSCPKWSADNWMQDEAKSGLVPYDLHIHDLDFIISLLGVPESFIANRTKSSNGSIPDHFWVDYHYNNCTIITESAWFKGPYPFSSGFRVLFENALVEYNNDKLHIYENNAKEPMLVEMQKNNTAVGINLPGTNAYDYEIAYFADCIHENKPISMVQKSEVIQVLQTIRDAVKSATANYRSSDF